MSKLSFIFLSFVLLFNCRNAKKACYDLDPKDHSITIILNGFIKPPAKIKLGEGIFIDNISTILTVWDSFFKTDIEADSISKNDTLHLKLNTNYALVEHWFKGAARTHYFLRAGDTLQITFLNGTPTGRIFNSGNNQPEATISQDLRELSLSTNSMFTDFEIYTYPIIGSSLYSKDFNSVVQSKKLEAFAKAKQKFEAEIEYLDSLKMKNLISNESFIMFSNRAYYLSNLMALEQNLLSDDSTKKIISNGKFTFPGMPYSFLQDFLEGWVTKTILPFVKSINASDMNIKDYREVYNRIEETDSVLKDEFKERLLLKYLDLIADNFSTTDTRNYVDRFILKYPSAGLLDEFNKKHFVDFDEFRLASDSLFLIDGNKRKQTFKSLLLQNDNKLLYVDFWASWCIPCREAMPASKEIREKYKNKAITFVYFSIDKNFENWQKASIAEGIASYDENYLVVNPATSQYLKSLRIEEIPRYLLFDFNGALIYPDAPGPKSNLLIIEIEKLLNRK